MKIEEIKKLIRRDARTPHHWFFTIRWLEVDRPKSSDYLEKRCCYDSLLYSDYRLCQKNAKEYVNKLISGAAGREPHVLRGESGDGIKFSSFHPEW